MILTDWWKKIKQKCLPASGVERPLVWLSFLVLTNLLAFGLGRLTILVGEQEPITVDYQLQKDSPRASLRTVLDTSASQIVASKNGTKYHLPNCPGAKQIKESNKIFFTSVEEATRAGYTPAANCPGL